jgi:metal-dependent HD superfamily phosphatase/phosphodiesterase
LRAAGKKGINIMKSTNKPKINKTKTDKPKLANSNTPSNNKSPVKSVKEQSLNEKIINALKALGVSAKIQKGVKQVLEDEEIHTIQEYANNVSIVRLRYNDHGPVHMRTVVLNAIIMLGFLKEAGIKTSLETEGVGDFEDSLLGIVYAAMLHDLGMSIGRQDHEVHSAYLVFPILERLLTEIYKDNLKKRIIIRSTALEGITGHMGNRTINSLEAGIVQVADGCDMTKGRARIPMALNMTARAGNIHQFSANSIDEVKISRGVEKPINIMISMSSEVGLFQIEEVLLAKIAVSTAKPYIELYAQVGKEKPKRYL